MDGRRELPRAEPLPSVPRTVELGVEVNARCQRIEEASRLVRTGSVVSEQRGRIGSEAEPVEIGVELRHLLRVGEVEHCVAESASRLADRVPLRIGGGGGGGDLDMSKTRNQAIE